MWTNLCRSLARSIDLLLPPACLLCGQQLQPCHNRQSFCPDCLTAIHPLDRAQCNRCAQPFPNATSSHLCGTCLKRPLSFSMVHAVGKYQEGIKEAVHKLKYRNQLSLAEPLGQLLGTTLAEKSDDFIADLIVPVPLHHNRLRQRGYNQALELARPLARQLRTPLDTTLLQRVRNTPQQQGLSAKERRSNLRNAFTLTAQTPCLKILLIDDVMTTGETVRECCRTLLSGGVLEIHVAVIGRA